MLDGFDLWIYIVVLILIPTNLVVRFSLLDVELSDFLFHFFLFFYSLLDALADLWLLFITPLVVVGVDLDLLENLEESLQLYLVFIHLS